MPRIVGIIILVAGLLVRLSYDLMGVTWAKWLGLFAMLMGALVFGLSFIPQPAPGETAPQPMPPAEGLTRVFYEPEPVFKNLRHHPRWLAAFLVLALFSVIHELALTQRLGPERIAIDRADRYIEGGFVKEEVISPENFKRFYVEGAKRTATIDKITLPFWKVGTEFAVILLLAGVFFLCALAFGGRLNFWQALSVAVYSALPPIVISKSLDLLLLYIQSPDDIIPTRAQQRGIARADLGILFSPIAHPFLYTFASAISLFSLYGWWLAVTGLKHTGEKISGGYAWTIAFILWLLGTLITLILPIIAPTFVG